MSEKFEVDKKDYLEMKITKLEKEISDADAQIEKLKAKKEEAKAYIKQIKADNRDIYPARGRKAKS